MLEISKEKFQISASVNKEVVNAISAHFKALDRSFSYGVAQILEEWVERLKSPENAPEQKHE